MNRLLKFTRPLIIIFLFASCSSENSTPEESSKDFKTKNSQKVTLQDIINNPALVGTIHNEVMDDLYKKVLVTNPAVFNNETSKTNFINTTVKNSIESKVNFGNINGYAFYSQLDLTNDVQPQKLTEFQDEIDNLIDLKLTPTAFKNESTKVYKIYKNYTPTASQYQLNLSIAHELANSSYTYWYTNGANWATAGNKNPKPDYTPIVKADCKGLVIGAVRGGLAGAGAGGIGAVPGALFGGLFGAAMKSSFAGVRWYIENN